MKDELRDKIIDDLDLLEYKTNERVADYITENYIPKNKLLWVDDIMKVILSFELDDDVVDIAQTIFKAQEDKITCNKGSDV